MVPATCLQTVCKGRKAQIRFFLHACKKLEFNSSNGRQSQIRVKGTDGTFEKENELQNGFRGAILALELAAWQIPDSQKLG